MPNLRVYIFAADPTSSDPVTGLTLTDFEVDVWRVNKSTQVQSQIATNAQLMKEIGEGFYYYQFSDIDTLTYDYMATVSYTGATALDTTLWSSVEDDNGVNKYASLLSFDLVASIINATVTGLVLADFEVDVFRVTKSDNQVNQIATAVAMTMEVGDGHYAYYLAECDFVTYDYLVLVQYEGATVLDGTVWTGKPTGDIPAESSCAPSYRRVLPRTLLPLDRWAEIIGIDPRHFRQVTTSVKKLTTCSNVWMQYSWQQVDQVARYDVADAIQKAEMAIAQYLGYKLLPTWEYGEYRLTAKPGNPELLGISNYDIQGYRQSVKADWGHFIEAGVEAKSEIEANTAVTYTDDDGDGYYETATVTVTTTVTDDEEIAVFYPCEDGADEWEIRPLRSVSISGGVATIKMWRHQLVQPDLIEALSPDAVDGDVDANFLTTVDVYRRYNDDSEQATLIWQNNLINCNCSTSTTCCPTCSQTTQDACLMPKDYESNILMYRPASYSDGEWSTAVMTCNRNPDIVQIHYRAGFRNQKLNQPMLKMDPQWERAVAFYALTLLDRDLCGCNPVKALADRMREDLARQTINGSSFQINDRVLNNPLGTTRAAVMAWNMINEPNRILASAVRW